MIKNLRSAWPDTSTVNGCLGFVSMRPPSKKRMIKTSRWKIVSTDMPLGVMPRCRKAMARHQRQKRTNLHRIVKNLKNQGAKTSLVKHEFNEQYDLKRSNTICLKRIPQHEHAGGTDFQVRPINTAGISGQKTLMRHGGEEEKLATAMEADLIRNLEPDEKMFKYLHVADVVINLKTFLLQHFSLETEKWEENSVDQLVKEMIDRDPSMKGLFRSRMRPGDKVMRYVRAKTVQFLACPSVKDAKSFMEDIANDFFEDKVFQAR